MGEELRINLNYMTKMAESISKKGYNISEKFEKILFHIRTMQNYWQSSAYRNFVNNINNMVEKYVEISNYYTTILPEEISIKRNMYAKERNELEELPQLYIPFIIDKIIIREQGDDIIYKFSAMEIKINRVINAFDDIKSYLNSIEDDFKMIVWEEMHRTEMQEKFENYFYEVQKIIKYMNEIFQNDLIGRNGSHEIS